jgi:quercetin dioxygenase-like cupin family protein
VTRRSEGVGVHAEERGTLLAVELDDVAFGVRRVFVVTGPPGGAWRGGHTADCAEHVVLLAGSARFEVAEREVTLEVVGDSLVVAAGEHVRYLLPDERSQVMVLAESPYDGSTRGAPW